MSSPKSNTRADNIYEKGQKTSDGNSKKKKKTAKKSHKQN